MLQTMQSGIDHGEPNQTPEKGHHRGRETRVSISATTWRDRKSLSPQAAHRLLVKKTSMSAVNPRLHAKLMKWLNLLMTMEHGDPDFRPPNSPEPSAGPSREDLSRLGSFDLHAHFWAGKSDDMPSRRHLQGAGRPGLDSDIINVLPYRPA